MSSWLRHRPVVLLLLSILVKNLLDGYKWLACWQIFGILCSAITIRLCHPWPVPHVNVPNAVAYLSSCYTPSARKHQRQSQSKCLPEPVAQALTKSNPVWTNTHLQYQGYLPMQRSVHILQCRCFQASLNMTIHQPHIPAALKITHSNRTQQCT